MARTSQRIVWLALLGSVLLIPGCDVGTQDGNGSPFSSAAHVGEEPVPTVHLMENHSSALIAWRRADARDRILLHLDGHADLDWLPDETIARIGISRPQELSALELHPYATDATTYERFGIWNFVYAAFRLGQVREFIWVVPDGTLTDPGTAQRFVYEVILSKLERVSLEEAAGLVLVGRTLRGEILGLPTTICELADLPPLDEPVLLDIDLDYFTTKSGLSMYVTERPWIQPGTVISMLHARSVRTDIATLSLSTLGGYLPPANRWLGHYLLDRLRAPGSAPGRVQVERMKAIEKELHGEHLEAAERYRDLLAIDESDACGWYGLSRCLETAGRPEEAAEAMERAVSLDPILGHRVLFEADRMWLNGDHAAALPLYESYLEGENAGRFLTYALRRKAGCLVTLDRDREAMEAYEELVEQAPDHADSLLELGILYRDMNAYNRAIGLLSRARQVLPHRSAYAIALGNTLVMSGSVDEGVTELRAAVSHKPCSVLARASLVMALLRLGRYPDAARHVRIGLRLDPGNLQLRQLAANLQGRGVPIRDSQSSAQ